MYVSFLLLRTVCNQWQTTLPVLVMQSKTHKNIGSTNYHYIRTTFAHRLKYNKCCNYLIILLVTVGVLTSPMPAINFFGYSIFLPSYFPMSYFSFLKKIVPLKSKSYTFINYRMILLFKSKFITWFLYNLMLCMLRCQMMFLVLLWYNKLRVTQHGNTLVTLIQQ